MRPVIYTDELLFSMIEVGETTATLDAITYGGEKLIGNDVVRIVPD